MNIYAVSWVQFGDFGLHAVVIAATEDEAISELRLMDADYNTEIDVRRVGVCTDGTSKATVLAEESL